MLSLLYPNGYMLKNNANSIWSSPAVSVDSLPMRKDLTEVGKVMVVDVSNCKFSRRTTYNQEPLRFKRKNQFKIEPNCANVAEKLPRLDVARMRRRVNVVAPLPDEEPDNDDPAQGGPAQANPAVQPGADGAGGEQVAPADVPLQNIIP